MRKTVTLSFLSGRQAQRAQELEARRREFESAARQHDREIYVAALRMTGKAEDAEDLAQDTFIRAYTHFHQFERGTNFRAWLFRILTTTFINQYRKRTREPAAVSYEELLIEPAAERSLSQQDRNPLEMLLAQITDEDIEAALKRLPEEFRTVVVLCDISELSYQEIADNLKIPIGTVRSRLSRGRTMLQRLLRNYASERGMLRP